LYKHELTTYHIHHEGGVWGLVFYQVWIYQA
jgi:hypothetical protein